VITVARSIEVDTPRQSDLTDVRVLFEDAKLSGVDAWQAEYRKRKNLQRPEAVA
jgi:hypothetical protein